MRSFIVVLCIAAHFTQSRPHRGFFDVDCASLLIQSRAGPVDFGDEELVRFRLISRPHSRDPLIYRALWMVPSHLSQRCRLHCQFREGVREKGRPPGQFHISYSPHVCLID